MECGVRVHKDGLTDRDAAADGQLYPVSGGSAGGAVFAQHYSFPHGG